MKETYLVLRSTTSGSRSDGLNMRPEGEPTNLQTSVEEMDSREFALLRKSHDFYDAAEIFPMHLLHPTSHSNLSALNQPNNWGIKAIGAHASELSGDGVTVAILDTGIDASHPAFEGVHLQLKNFTKEADGDENGHGTHCAGTLFGRPVDGRRIGVAPGVKRAIIGKVLGNGGSDSITIANAIEWAVQEGAQVVSMSLGFNFPGYQQSLVKRGLPAELATSRALSAYANNIRLFDALATYAETRATFGQPVFLVAASGNDSRTDKQQDFKLSAVPPSTAKGFISVGAAGISDNQFIRAPFSNINVALVAPGVDIISAKAGGGLTAMSGTSMATPHVAGAIALFCESALRKNKPLKIERLKSQLIDAAQAINGANYDDVGEGLVQCPKA